MPDVIHRTLQEDELRDILLDEPEVRMATQVNDVVPVAGHEVVDGNDPVPALQEQIHQMRPEKAGAAGDHRGGRASGAAGPGPAGGGEAGETLMAVNRVSPSVKAQQDWRGRVPGSLGAAPHNTTGMVCRIRILRSSQSDQLSMYSRSNRTQSLKSSRCSPADLPQAGDPRLTLSRRR